MCGYKVSKNRVGIFRSVGPPEHFLTVSLLITYNPEVTLHSYIMTIVLGAKDQHEYLEDYFLKKMTLRLISSFTISTCDSLNMSIEDQAYLSTNT